VPCRAAITRAQATAKIRGATADAWTDAIARCAGEDALVTALFSGAKASASARRYDEAIDQAQHALTLFPSYGEYYWLGECYEKKGMPDKAIEFYLKAMTGAPDEVPLRRSAYEKSGLPGYWQEEERIRRRKNYKVSPVRQDEYYVHRGMKEAAVQQLQLAYKQHVGGLELIRVHPVFDDVRNDPRFRELLVHLGLE